MLTLFLLSVALIGGPVLVSYADPSVRRIGWSWAIPAAVFSLGGICVAGGLLHPGMAYGWAKLFIVEIFVTLWVWWILRHVTETGPRIDARCFLSAAAAPLPESLLV